MAAQWKYDDETRERAVRMYLDRRRESPGESALAARRRVGELLDVKPETLRGWIERGGAYPSSGAGLRPLMTLRNYGSSHLASGRIFEIVRRGTPSLRSTSVILPASSARLRWVG